MMTAYADFFYQMGLVDEMQRDYFASKFGEAVDLINEEKWVEAGDVNVICCR